MLKIVLIFFNLASSVLLLSLISWFELKENEIRSVNSKHKRDIQKLKKIPSLNAAIEKYVRPALKIQPKSAEEADLKLIKFFDAYAQGYNFKVNRYVYSDNIAHYLDISYSLQRADMANLNDFMKSSFESGFIQFKEFKVAGEQLIGEIQLVQPYKNPNPIVPEVSDDVPQ